MILVAPGVMNSGLFPSFQWKFIFACIPTHRAGVLLTSEKPRAGKGGSHASALREHFSPIPAALHP